MTVLSAGETFGEVCRGPGSASLSLHAAHDSTPRHEHTHPYACVVIGGGFRQTLGRKEAEARFGEVLLHPAGAAHADLFGPDGALCLNLQLKADPADRVRRRLDAGALSLAEAVAAQVALGRDADPLTAQSLAAELVDRLLRPEVEAAEERWHREIIAALSNDPARAWRLEALAALAGRHPTHVARSFRMRTGLSLGAFRRRRRLTAVCLALRLRDTSLAELAAEHGFSDQAHMTREFRRFTGASPAAWRRAAR
jgi:AraC family transcriptional regulator